MNVWNAVNKRYIAAAKLNVVSNIEIAVSWNMLMR